MFSRATPARRDPLLQQNNTPPPTPMRAEIARGPTLMKRVIVESPFGSDDPAVVKRNIDYARDACRDCVGKGENPFASHVFYTQFLDDRNPAERKLGIDMGFQHWQHADTIVFYLDLGMSSGMQAALLRAFSLGLHIERRFMGRVDQPEPIPAGVDIETALKELLQPASAEQGGANAQDSNSRTDGSEDSNAVGVGSGVDLQRS